MCDVGNHKATQYYTNIHNKAAIDLPPMFAIMHAGLLTINKPLHLCMFPTK